MQRKYTAVSAVALLLISTLSFADDAKVVVNEIPEAALPVDARFPVAANPEFSWGGSFGGNVVDPTGDFPNMMSSFAIAPSPVLMGIEAGVVILDKLVNLGKSIWDIVKSGEPTVNIQTDIASVVPQGITDWEEMETWQTPVSKLYKAELVADGKRSLGDFYFRLMFTPGGSYKGKGKYLATVSIIPAQVTVPYRKALSAQAKVTGMMNHGTAEDPIAGLLLTMQWSVDSTFRHSSQSVTFHVRGDGAVNKYPDDSDTAEDIDPAGAAPGAARAAPGAAGANGLGNSSWYGWSNPHP